MNDEDRYIGINDEERMLARKKRHDELMARRRKTAKRNRIIFALAVVIVLALVVVIAVTASGKASKKVKEASGENTANTEIPEETAAEGDVFEADEILEEAQRLRMMYDYDGAVSLLQNADAEKYSEEIKSINEDKASCTVVDVEKVPHIFFHSLINDSRGWDPEVCGDFQARDNACWMCSAEEFNAVIQQMYDAGYVMVSLHDLVETTVDDEGNKHFSPNKSLMLPPGKKAFVLSEDDLSYYHAYDNQGIASRLVIDDSGKVKCEYTDADGNTKIGDYDVVPLINSFVEKHPDFSYRGAKVTIALTGYNGVFGYRTDKVYLTRDEERLDPNQKEWLEANPDFNFDEDVTKAKEIAEALKADGFEFASHTWGHRHADTASVESLIQDNERWVESVEPIVGDVDTIIFAHGSDISTVAPYDSENEKYVYYKNSGYDFFCNVDGSVPYWFQIGDGYVRSGRINIDGYFLWKVLEGKESAVIDANYLGIHDIDTFFDYNRITPVEIPE